MSDIKKWISKNFSKVDSLSEEFLLNGASLNRCKTCGKIEKGIKGTLRGRKISGVYTYPDLRKRGNNQCSHCGSWKKANEPRKVYKRTCHECSKDFNALIGKAKFCSSECRVKNVNKVNLKRYEKVCEVCENPFVTNRKSIKVCSEDCKKELVKIRHRVKPTVNNCKYCNKKIKGRKGIKYCNQTCSNKYRQLHTKKKTERKCNSCDNMVKIPAQKCQECKEKAKPEIITKTCPTCETEFISTVHNKKYCKRSHSPASKELRKLSKRSRRKQRTSAKLSVESWNDISKFRKSGSENMHLDHIVPLNHPDVCGLHNTWNFQWLTPEENIFKSNSFDGTNENDSWKDDFKK